MSTENIRTLLRARFTETQFRPYALAIGQATLAWNDLHEHLGRLYGMVMTRSERSAQLAVWQSSRQDRAKREMLAAGLELMPFEPPGWTEDLRLYVPWILREVDRVEDRRNNAIHAPLHLVVDVTKVRWPLDRAAFLEAGEVQPQTWSRNTRAKRLEQKQLLTEYRECRDDALALRDLVFSIGNCVERRRGEQLNYVWPRVPERLAARMPRPIREHQVKTAKPAGHPSEGMRELARRVLRRRSGAKVTASGAGT